ncbi:MAG: hypothetical protein VKP62_09960 [Candidatus Sericytochromatia bacterium]|nr:hypothetical protein [Candidatus Sericytochromatia bacterium]
MNVYPFAAALLLSAVLLSASAASADGSDPLEPEAGAALEQPLAKPSPGQPMAKPQRALATPSRASRSARKRAARERRLPRKPHPQQTPVAAKRPSPVPKAELVLPEAAPHYDAKGKYIPTVYIYQETNGEFRILNPKAQEQAQASGAVSPRDALQDALKALGVATDKAPRPRGGDSDRGGRSAGNAGPAEAGSSGAGAAGAPSGGASGGGPSGDSSGGAPAGAGSDGGNGIF